MTVSPRLGATYLATTGQASAEPVVNSILNYVEVAATMEFLDRDLTAPPGTNDDGDIYLVASGATGGWASQDGNIAIYYNGWKFITPIGGMKAFVADEKIWIGYSSAESAWHPLQDVYSTSEYWTGEYFNTAKVYCKYVSVGTLPDTTTENTAHSITGLATLVELRITADNGTRQIQLPYQDIADSGEGRCYAHVTDTNIVIVSDADYSGYTGTAKIKYTKS